MNSEHINLFLKEIHSVNENRNESFREIVSKSELILNLSDRDFAREFHVSCPSIRRWRDGKIIPAVYMRKYVFKFLETKALELLMKSNSN